MSYPWLSSEHGCIDGRLYKRYADNLVNRSDCSPVVLVKTCVSCPGAVDLNAMLRHL